MGPSPPVDDNPFAPPRSAIGPRAAEVDFEADAQAELIRRHHLSLEASIRSLGLLCYLGAAIGALGTIVSVLTAIGVVEEEPPPPGWSVGLMRLALWAISAVGAIVAVVSFALGFGFRRFQAWARWMGVVLAVLSLLYCLFLGVFLLAALGADRSLPVLLGLLAFAAAILAYVLTLLVSPRAGVVFSGEYRSIIRKTPRIASPTSLITRIGLGLVYAWMALGLWGILEKYFW